MGRAAPVIVTVVAVVATVYAGPVVGEAILASMGTTAAASGVSAATVGAAAIGGSTSAVNAAIQGKNVEGVLKAGAIGAASGAIGSEIAQGVTGAEQAGPFVDASGNVVQGPSTGLTGELGTSGAKIAGGGAGGASSSFTRSQLSGQNLEQSLKNAEIGGATGAITSAIGEGFKGAGGDPTDARLASAISGPFVAQNVSNLFAPQRSTGTTGRGGATTQEVGTVPTTGQGAPGSAALGQALRIGDPGAPVESPGGGESSRQPVWNLASLRVKDETGSSS
jgi:hypothetical protein